MTYGGSHFGFGAADPRLGCVLARAFGGCTHGFGVAVGGGDIGRTARTGHRLFQADPRVG